MQEKPEYQRLKPLCVNYDCGRPVAINRGKPRPHCSACQRARWETGGARKLIKKELKENPNRIQPTPFHKFRCSNSDSHLGFPCPCRNDLPKDFRLPTDIDHIDGDTWNNISDNVEELCRLCHVLKGKNNGDMKGFRYGKKNQSE
jgi:hypothetical protein